MKKKEKTKRRSEENLALLISDVLNHPDMPEHLHGCLIEALVTFCNEHIDQDQIGDFQQSPAYIEMRLRGHRAKCAGNVSEY